MANTTLHSLLLGIFKFFLLYYYYYLIIIKIKIIKDFKFRLTDY